MLTTEYRIDSWRGVTAEVYGEFVDWGYRRRLVGGWRGE